MFGLVKKLFGGILAFIGNIFSFGKKDKKIAAVAEPKAVKAAPPENKKQPKAKKQSKPKAAFFLENEDARGFTSANGKSAPSPKKAAPVAAATASALNLPAPTVSSAPAESAPFIQFARRRPGANMSAFLDMAKQVKTSN
jgi:hypothetical protein